MKKIFVTRPNFPDKEKFKNYIDQIWENKQLTNHGPLHNDLEQRLKEFLNVDYLHFTTNGTLALQIAIRAMGLNGYDIITTPFSYVATTSSILWENCNPIFVDIDSSTLCIDPKKIEAAITKNTKAILAVHVFGNPCAIEAIEEIAKKHDLKIIYDAAHAFGCTYKNKSLLDYGDLSISSFHATKTFHTIEGGCVISHDKITAEKIYKIRSFGHIGDEHFELGFNAKASELQAAMGLLNLEAFENGVRKRKDLFEEYNASLDWNKLEKQKTRDNFIQNYGYYPVIFENENMCLSVIDALNKEDIFPRRYFYPSLNTIPYLRERASCPISEDITKRILCLPLYATLDMQDVKKISSIINEVTKE